MLAPTLPGHAGGPPLADEPGVRELLDAIERALDEAGFATAHVVGNSLGGYLALQLAARGRAESVVARYLHDWLPHADWIVLDGVGHCPQLDVPLETAQLILGLTSP